MEKEKVCIVYNDSKVKGLSLFKETIRFFIDKGFGIVGIEKVMQAKYAVVIGGDGTLLRASKKLAKKKGIKIIAINMGSLGFLTETKKEEAFDMYNRLLNGDYEVERRRFLEVETYRGTFLMLNDLVLSKPGALSKLIRVSVTSTDGFINTYRADGIIISTPTGSTAYSLSAGGPILKPTLNAIIITPIAPHNLSTRAIVIDGDEELTLEVADEDRRGQVAIDGDRAIKISKGNSVKVRYSDDYLELVVPPNRNYYGVLREKLKWGDDLC